ncbi:leucine--tRNA ligase [Rickettsiales bacterium]|nr:leucine--tRNA ligase [Rickettsiales bacterium]
MTYNHKKIEEKWQKIWEKEEFFKFTPKKDQKKYYVLEMFPFPSGKIHVGHLRNYTIGDVIARFKKMQNFNVLHPIGFDSFGLPAENAAIENNSHPKDWTYDNIATMEEELKKLGFSYDWDRKLATCDQDYYKFEQKMFIDFYKNGLIYQKESIVNWDPIDQTVLANEQVIDGKGWRSGAEVEKKKLKQWFLKISDFSEELLSELKNLTGWDKRVLTMQEKWIGKSSGASINFNISNGKKLEVYTTRPETIFGASFVGIAANHPLALQIAKNDQKAADFIKECEQNSANEAEIDKNEKKGYQIALFADHPFIEGKKLPIYIANFILMDYGTGAIFACPAHDQRDFDFAKKYNLPITQIIGKEQELKEAYLEDGKIINSQFLNDLKIVDAKEKIINLLEEKQIGARKINYRLKDWGVSRQRYWGCPIPMIYDKNGNVMPVPESDLPVILPEDPDFSKGGNPLDHHQKWQKVTINGEKYIRETDTLDTFFESSWYFLRFASNPKDKAFNFDEVNEILPVDNYIGGIEHAVLHLLYARFFTKALKKCGYLNFDEPFKNLLTQGMVCHKTFKDKNGKWVMPKDVIFKENKAFCKKTNEEITIGRSEKMSKSKKNVVDPMQIIENFGADTARFFMMSDSPAEKDIEWSDNALNGCHKFLKKIYNLTEEFTNEFKIADIDFSSQDDLKDLSEKQIALIKLTHKAIFEIKNEYEKSGFNVVIAKIREFTNNLEKFTINDKNDQKIKFFAIKNLILLIYPICSHLSEELWQKLGFKKALSDQILFPNFNQDFITEDKIKIAIQIRGKLKKVIEINKDLDKKQLENIILSDDLIQKNISGQEVKKMIFVPNKLVNIVI